MFINVSITAFLAPFIPFFTLAFNPDFSKIEDKILLGSGL